MMDAPAPTLIFLAVVGSAEFMMSVLPRSCVMFSNTCPGAGSDLHSGFWYWEGGKEVACGASESRRFSRYWRKNPESCSLHAI